MFPPRPEHVQTVMVPCCEAVSSEGQGRYPSNELLSKELALLMLVFQQGKIYMLCFRPVLHVLQPV